jgi:hypothetical protein
VSKEARNASKCHISADEFLFPLVASQLQISFIRVNRNPPASRRCGTTEQEVSGYFI